MAIRVNPDEVEQIISTDLTNLMPFIRSANIIVDKLLASDGDLDADQLQEIELWLSAHFVAIRDPVAKSESIGSTSITYFLSEPGKGLLATPYGQVACALDTTGKLANVAKAKAGLKAIDLEL